MIPFWRDFGCLGASGRSWGLLGASWDRLRASWPRLGASCILRAVLGKTLIFPKVFQCFLLPWGGFGWVLGGVLVGSWGRLGVYLGRLRVCFGDVLGRLASWGVLGATWAVLVGVLGRLEGSWGHMAGFWEPLSGTVWGRIFWGWV